MPPDEERDTDRDWFAVDPKGQVRDPDAPPRRGPPPLGILAAVLVVGVGGIAIINRMGATDPPRPSPNVSATTASLPSPTSAPTVTAGTPLAVPKVTTLGHPVLGVTGSWNLLARGSGLSIRIEMASGRVTSTPVPNLDSGGPVSFLAGPDRVLIRPMDSVQGYVVPDGAATEPAKGVLALGGFVFPGPDSSHVWATSGTEEKPLMSLVAMDGSSSGGRQISIPPDMSPFSAQTDGAGSLIFEGTSGSYAVRADGLHRITTGRVLAGWSRGWLVSECDDRHQCSTAVVDRETGARRSLGASLGPSALDGAVSPDGRFAAVSVDTSNVSSLVLIDLASGSRRQLPVVLTASYGGGSYTWSPDSRWLLAVATNNTIRAIDPQSGRVSALGVTLPPVDQVAVRP